MKNKCAIKNVIDSRFLKLERLVLVILSTVSVASAGVQESANNGYSLVVKLPETLPVGDVLFAEVKDASGSSVIRVAGDSSAVNIDLWTGRPPADRVDPSKNKKFRLGDETFQTRMKEGRLIQSVSLELLEKSRTRELFLVVTPAKISLYLDGVLVDEEWPPGLRQFTLPLTLTTGTGVTASLEMETPGDHAVALRYGEVQIQQSWKKFFGTHAGVPPYFRPVGAGTHAGDCFPMYQDGRWHLFYLYDRRNHNSKFSYGGFSWGHISTTDLVHWTEHPPAVQVTEPWEGSIPTGSVISNGSEFLAFTTPLNVVELPGAQPGLRIARSPDGIHFTKGTNVVPNVALGDPDVFRMEDGRYGLITRGHEKGVRKFAFHTSTDLFNWQREANCPFDFAPDNCDCPHYFRMGSWHYFFSSRIARKSESLDGPWIEIPVSGLGIPKTAPWKDGRRLIAGSISDGGWGGDAILHELVQFPDGNLGDKFIDEMTPVTGELLAISPVPMLGNSTISEGHVLVNGQNGFSSVALDAIPQMTRIRLTAKTAAVGGSFGVVLRGNGDYAAGLMAKFDPAQKTVSMGPVTGKGQFREVKKLSQVNGLEKPVSLDIILGPEGLVDLEINNERCLAFRGAKDSSFNRIFLFSDKVETDFQDIDIRPWKPTVTVEHFIRPQLDKPLLKSHER